MLIKQPSERITIPEIKNHPYFKKYGVTFDVSPQTPRTTEFVGLGVGPSLGVISTHNMINSVGLETGSEFQSQDYQKIIEQERKLYRNKIENHMSKEKSLTLVTKDCLKKYSSDGVVMKTFSHTSTSTYPVSTQEELREISDNEYRDLLMRHQLYKKRRNQLGQLA